MNHFYNIYFPRKLQLPAKFFRKIKTEALQTCITLIDSVCILQNFLYYTLPIIT